MKQNIEIPVVNVLGLLDSKALATELLKRVSAAGVTAAVTGIPNIGEIWPGQGGINAGLVRGRDGGPDYYQIVNLDELKDATWQKALDWAKGLEADGHRDFSLPWRREQAVLYGNVPELFEKEYYWSRERHAENYGYAWCQSFVNGHQLNHNHDHSLRARAVRRLVI